MLPLGFLACTHSRIRRIVKICEVMYLLLRNPSWFFRSIFSILGSMQLRSRALYTLAVIDVMVISQLFLANSRSPLLEKGRVHLFIHLSIGFWLYTTLQCWNSMSSNHLVFHTSGGISSSPATFLFLIFLRTESSSTCVNIPNLFAHWYCYYF